MTIERGQELNIFSFSSLYSRVSHLFSAAAPRGGLRPPLGKPVFAVTQRFNRHIKKAPQPRPASSLPHPGRTLSNVRRERLALARV